MNEEMRGKMETKTLRNRIKRKLTYLKYALMFTKHNTTIYYNIYLRIVTNGYRHNTQIRLHTDYLAYLHLGS